MFLSGSGALFRGYVGTPLKASLNNGYNGSSDGLSVKEPIFQRGKKWLISFLSSVGGSPDAY
jgi:hypothetical protein